MSAARAAIAIGTLIKNTNRQRPASARTPPISGPATVVIVVAADQVDVDAAFIEGGQGVQHIEISGEDDVFVLEPEIKEVA